MRAVLRLCTRIGRTCLEVDGGQRVKQISIEAFGVATGLHDLPPPLSQAKDLECHDDGADGHLQVCLNGRRQEQCIRARLLCEAFELCKYDICACLALNEDNRANVAHAKIFAIGTNML
eukprot:6948-Heterococcus_DN1.PRE.2